MHSGNRAIIDVSHGDHIGQIEFALGILVVETRQPLTQLAPIGHQHAGVHLSDRQLFGVGILLLDDADYLTIFTDDTAITGGVVQYHGQQCHPVFSLGSKQSLQGLWLDQRGIAVQHQHIVFILPERDGLGDGVTGPQLLRLQHPVHIGRHDPLFQQLGTVAIDQMQLLGTDLTCSIDHMGNHRFVGYRVEYLGQGGAHAGTFTRSQDHDVEGHKLTFGT